MPISYIINSFFNRYETVIRVLIVDDHPIVRQGLRWMLDAATGMEVSGEAANGVEALKELRKGKFDIVLLDISMPEKNGIDTMKDILDHESGVKVLILSMHPEDKYAVCLMKTGASGYLTKEAVPKQLVEAIQEVAAGKKYVSPHLAKLLLQDSDNNSGMPPHNPLTNMEYQVLRLMGSGNILTGIAEILSLNPKTVNFYRVRILEKMKMNSDAELVFYAIQNGLTDIRPGYPTLSQ